MKLTKTVKSGFTMVEFSLATAFIAILLITITIVSSNIITIYQKGLALKAVNSVGRGLVDELVTGINAAPSVDTTSLCNSHLLAGSVAACKADHANNFIFQHKVAPRSHKGGEQIDGSGASNVQMGGILCTGNYSYVWNTYYGLEPTGRKLSLTYTYRDASGNPVDVTLTDFRLLRVEDPTYLVCSASTTDDYRSKLATDGSYSNIDIRYLANSARNFIEHPQEGFLNGFDLDLDLYELTIFPISQDNVTLRSFFSGTFILATDRGNINLARSGDYCDVNAFDDVDTTTLLGDLGSEFTYCAINKFNFAARTAGM